MLQNETVVQRKVYINSVIAVSHLCLWMQSIHSLFLKQLEDTHFVVLFKGGLCELK